VSAIDLLGLAALAAGSATGALTGALRQVVHLGALGLAGLLAPALGPLLARPLGKVLPLGGLAAAAGAFAAFALCFAALSLAGHLALRAGERRARRSAADRGLGALLGGLQTAFGLWAVLSLLVLWDRPIGRGGLRIDPRQGDLAAFAREHNLLEAVLPARLRQVRETLPAAREALERGALERAGEGARRAREALEQADRAARP
jgi:hypothetical protein